MRVWPAVPVAGVLLVLAACGGGSGSSGDIASGGADGTTTTSMETSTTSAAAVTTTTAARATTTTAARATTTTAVAATTTTRKVATTPGPPQTPVTGPLTTPPTARQVDDYLPAGLPEQVFPPGTTPYQALVDGKCGPLLRQIATGEAPSTSAWSAGGVPPAITDLYTAAGNACLAQWAPAQAAFQRVATAELCEHDSKGVLANSSLGFTSVAACQEQRLRVYKWTENLLKAHIANPAFVPNFRKPPQA